MHDYLLWKTWWYAALYGASPETRMRKMDAMRKKLAEEG